MKKLLIVLVVIVVVVVGGIFLVGALLPPAYSVERSTVVEAPAAAIFPYMNDLRRWSEWTAWTVERFPKMTMTFSGAPQGVGAVMEWKDPDNGNGKVTITTSDPEKGISYDLEFEGFPRAAGTLALEPAGTGTRVRMQVDGELGSSPIARIFGLMMDSMMGGDFEKGLAKLKAKAEAKAEAKT